MNLKKITTAFFLSALSLPLHQGWTMEDQSLSSSQPFSLKCVQNLENARTQENYLSYDFLKEGFDPWLNSVETRIKDHMNQNVGTLQSPELKEFLNSPQGKLLDIFKTLYSRNMETESYKQAAFALELILTYKINHEQTSLLENSVTKALTTPSTPWEFMEKFLKEFDTPSTIQADYGGSVGRLIFSSVLNKKITPLLGSFFTEAEAALALNPTDENYKKCFQMLLDTLGKERYFISELGGYSHKRFGLPTQNGDKLIDCVTNTPAWKNWHDYLVETLRPVLLSANYTYPDDQDTYYIMAPGKTTDLYERFLSVLMSQDDSLYTLISIILFRIIPYENDSAITIAGDEFSFDKEFLQRLTQNDEEAKQTLADMVFKNPKIAYNHIDNTPEFSVIDIILSDFKSLFERKDLSIDDMTKASAIILWTMSHSSTFHRGQAAITKWVLQGIAQWKGYDVTFDMMGLPEDQMALSWPGREQFIQECVKQNWIKFAKKTN